MKLKRLPSTSIAKFLLKLAAAFALLFAVFIVFEHTRGKHAYRELLEEMRTNGEETDVHKLAPEMPDESENMAAALKILLEPLSNLEDSPGGSIPSTAYVAPGVARPSWREDSWEQSISIDEGDGYPVYKDVEVTWTNVTENLASDAVSRERVKELLARPRFHTGFDYTDFTEMDSFALISAKKFGSAIRRRACLSLHNGEMTNAVDANLDLLHLAKSMKEEPTLISQFVRQAIANMAVAVTWDAMATKRLTHDDLVALLQGWKANDLVAPMKLAMRVERASSIAYIEKIRRSTASRNKLFDLMADPFVFHLYNDGFEESTPFSLRVHATIWRLAWIDQDALRTVQIWNAMIERSFRALDISPASAGVLTDPDEFLSNLLFSDPDESGSIYDQLRFVVSTAELGVDGAVAKNTTKSAARQSLAIAALALEVHRLENGIYPETLDALVPTIIDEVPRDYMDGTPLKYRRINGDEFLLYSSGEDGVDDGGDPNGTKSRIPGSYYYIWDGRDAVWPKAAE